MSVKAEPQAATRDARAAGRRTAWLLAAIAASVYVGFLLMGVLSQ